MNIEDGFVGEAIERCGNRIGYFHIGESHRGYLGTGTVDFIAVFRSLARIGYDGPIALSPSPGGGRPGALQHARRLAQSSRPTATASPATPRLSWRPSSSLPAHAVEAGAGSGRPAPSSKPL